MLLYHLRIAAKSLRRNPYLSGLLIFAVALGICIATSFTTLRHVLARDPLPRGRSGSTSAPPSSRSPAGRLP